MLRKLARKELILKFETSGAYKMPLSELRKEYHGY